MRKSSSALLDAMMVNIKYHNNWVQKDGRSKINEIFQLALAILSRPILDIAPNYLTQTKTNRNIFPLRIAFNLRAELAEIAYYFAGNLREAK